MVDEAPTTGGESTGEESTGGEEMGGEPSGGEPMDEEPMESDDSIRVWLVERTFSDDEQNMVILIYAAMDGAHYLRKERALTSFDDRRPTRAALDVPPSKLGETPESERARYAENATSMAAKYEPNDAI